MKPNQKHFYYGRFKRRKSAITVIISTYFISLSQCNKIKEKTGDINITNEKAEL